MGSFSFRLLCHNAHSLSLGTVGSLLVLGLFGWATLRGIFAFHCRFDKSEVFEVLVDYVDLFDSVLSSVTVVFKEVLSDRLIVILSLSIRFLRNSIIGQLVGVGAFVAIVSELFELAVAFNVVDRHQNLGQLSNFHELLGRVLLDLTF